MFAPAVANACFNVLLIRVWFKSLIVENIANTCFQSSSVIFVFANGAVV